MSEPIVCNRDEHGCDADNGDPCPECKEIEVEEQADRACRRAPYSDAGTFYTGGGDL